MAGHCRGRTGGGSERAILVNGACEWLTPQTAGKPLEQSVTRQL